MPEKLNERKPLPKFRLNRLRMIFKIFNCTGKIFNFQVLPDTYEPITIFILAPGAFFVLAGLTALQNKIKNRAQKKGKPVNNNDGCAGGCASCAGCGSTGTNE